MNPFKGDSLIGQRKIAPKPPETSPNLPRILKSAYPELGGNVSLGFKGCQKGFFGLIRLLQKMMAYRLQRRLREGHRDIGIGFRRRPVLENSPDFKGKDPCQVESELGKFYPFFLKIIGPLAGRDNGISFQVQIIPIIKGFAGPGV